jgi:hypothetical protein
MTDERPLSPSEEIYALLPWYAAGTLSEAERIRVDAALAEDDRLRESLARIEDERWLTIAVNEDIPPPRGAGIESIMARIEAQAPRPNRSASTVSGIWSGLLGVVAGLSPRAVAIAGVAAAIVILAEAGALIGVAVQPPVGQYVTASVEPSIPADQTVLLAAFRPDASMGQIIALLQKLGLTVLDGPRANGLFRLAVPTSEADNALTELKSHSELVSFAARSK